MMKHKMLIIFLALFIGLNGYSNIQNLDYETQILDTNTIDSTQINITKHSVKLICYNKTIAYIDTISGIVREANKMKYGNFIANGDIRDANGQFLGKIVGNEFEDGNGHLLGSINSLGEVLDMNNMKIGEIYNSTIIKDANNMKIGEVETVINKKWTAAYYFFYFR